MPAVQPCSVATHGRDAVSLHRRLAYVPGDVSLWPNLTGGEAIDLLGRLRGGLDPKRRADLLDRFDLDPTKKARTYSKGNRQKVALIAGLASDVELLVLDEPTSGLDPLMELAFRECIDELKEGPHRPTVEPHPLRGGGSLRSSQHHPRWAALSRRGSLAEMRHLTRTSIAVETERPPAGLDQLPGVHDLKIHEQPRHFDVDTDRISTRPCAAS